VTVLVAVPPALDVTVTDAGAGDVVTVTAYDFVFALYVIGHVPPGVTSVNAALGAAVLVACTLRDFLLVVYVAAVIVTVSAVGGAVTAIDTVAAFDVNAPSLVL
jgi:hypothetical protein